MSPKSSPVSEKPTSRMTELPSPSESISESEEPKVKKEEPKVKKEEPKVTIQTPKSTKSTPKKESQKPSTKPLVCYIEIRESLKWLK